jgi:hypothetical protein
MANPLLNPLRNYLQRLRFPQLFLLMAVLFVVDVIVPDVIPFIDEILLLIGTLLLGGLKRRRSEPTAR